MSLKYLHVISESTGPRLHSPIQIATGAAGGQHGRMMRRREAAPQQSVAKFDTLAVYREI